MKIFKKKLNLLNNRIKFHQKGKKMLFFQIFLNLPKQVNQPIN